MGEETMRACDHQSQRAIPVVQGRPESEQGDGQFFNIVNVTDPLPGRLRLRRGPGRR